MRAVWLTRRLGLFALICLLVNGLGFEPSAVAQSDAGVWETPVNISKSGGASQPAIAAAPDGTLHALWWDSAEGEKYAQTYTATGLDWTEPITVAQIYGRRKTLQDTETGKLKLALDPPLDLRLLSDSQGQTYAVWRDIQDQLWAAQGQGAAWGAATMLADSIVKVEAAAGPQGGVQVGYIRSQNSGRVPSGVYFQSASNGTWNAPSLVYGSLYFRTIKPETAHISLAVDDAGRVVIAWDDLELGQSVYARSADAGVTWSPPQSVSGNQTSQAVQTKVVSAPTGNLFLIWKNAGMVGCELRWRRSGDGGETWVEGGPLYSDAAACPQRLRFPPRGDGQSWLLGLLSVQQAANSGGRMALISWDGSRWSRSAEVNLNFKHPTLQSKELLLDDLDLALAGGSLGIIGMDGEGDIWAVRNAAPPSGLVPALLPVWDVPEVISDQDTSAQVKDPPAVAADPQGKLYALWSETSDSLESGSALHLAVKDQGRWSRTVQLTTAAAEAAAGSASGPLADEPALVIDGESRLHAVWRGGMNAEILHSWTFATDATSASTWTKPAALPMPGHPASWPAVVVDPISHTLHVIFAVPYNEGRGIYDVQSSDGGASWSSPAVIFDAAAARLESVDKPRLVIDTATHVLHAVWLQTALIGEPHGRAVLYAQSTDGGRTWSAPSIRAAVVSDWPRLAVAGPKAVYLVWNQPAASTEGSAVSSEVWGQVSSDGGRHWTGPKRIPGLEVTGPADLSADGAGGVYLVGMGRSGTGGATLLYTHWDGQTWSEPEADDLGYDAAPGNAVAAAFVLSSRRLDVTLQALIGTLGGGGQFRALATGRQVPAAPSSRPVPTLAPLPSPTATQTPIPLPTVSVGATPTLNVTNGLPPPNPSLVPISLSVIIGGVMIGLLVAGLIIFRLIGMVRR